MRNSPQNQGGMTFIAWLIVLIVAGFFIMLAMKLGPVYMEHYTIRMALEAMQKEPEVEKKSFEEIRGMLMKRLDVNYVTSLPRDAIKVRREVGGYKVIEVNYEHREPILGNVDAVLTFKDKVELTGP